MNNDNKLCTCNSGKKFKKCCKGKKPRITHITYDFSEMKTVSQIEVNTVTGEMIFSHDGEKIDHKSVKFDICYERTKNEKILNQIPIKGNFNIDPNLLLLRYDILFAIDTGWEKDSNYSVSCIVIGRVEPSGDGDLLFENTPADVFALWNVKEKQENLAWAILIEGIKQNSSYSKDHKVGIIVDSDLGNIAKYNARELPIYDKFYLPENMELLYASDRGNKKIAVTRMLIKAHDNATIFRKLVAAENELQDAVLVEGKPYTHIRWWNRDVIRAQYKSQK